MNLTDDRLTLFQVIAWYHQAESHYMNQCWPRSMSPYDVIRPQWDNATVVSPLLKYWRQHNLALSHCYDLYLNSLWPSDAIWCQRSWSTLVQVMACCLTAPSHYLYQCWLDITEVLWQSSDNNFTASTQATILRNEFENFTSKIIVRSSRGQWVKLSSKWNPCVYFHVFLPQSSGRVPHPTESCAQQWLLTWSHKVNVVWKRKEKTSGMKWQTLAGMWMLYTEGLILLVLTHKYSRTTKNFS